MMNDEKLESQPSGIDLNDIYYVLFRHKWKIVIFFVAGIVAASLSLGRAWSNPAATAAVNNVRRFT